MHPMLRAMHEPRRLTRAQVRGVDRRAIDELGIPGAVLMENAGRGAAEHTRALLAERCAGREPWRIAIVCGPGNNGGDGYVVARHLALAGCAVELYSTCEAASLRGDAALMRSIAERMGLVARTLDPQRLAEPVRDWERCHALVDAVLGTGAVGAARRDMAAVIEAIDAASGPLRVALDLPSGLDSDTGTPQGACVRADLTVTFVAEKVGFANPGAATYCGRVVVVGIGAPVLLDPLDV